MPSTNTAAPCLPNFFTKGKGSNGNTAIYKRQALYNSAIGARGIHELRAYISQEMLLNNNTYTVTSTYYSGTSDLTIYSTHPTLSNDPQNPIKYHIT